MSKTLVLTPWMAPHRIITWQTAVQDYFNRKVDILEEYDETIASAGSLTKPPIVMGMPCVVRLVKTVSAFKRGVKFSRINVFSRDGFRCQYCGRQFEMRLLNYDHVVPRSKGGQTVWTNIVTSCYGCNTKKDRRTPEQAGMKLLRKPYTPKTLPMTSPVFQVRDPPEKWLPYLQSAASVPLTG